MPVVFVAKCQIPQGPAPAQLRNIMAVLGDDGLAVVCFAVAHRLLGASKHRVVPVGGRPSRAPDRSYPELVDVCSFPTNLCPRPAGPRIDPTRDSGFRSFPSNLGPQRSGDRPGEDLSSSGRIVSTANQVEAMS